MHVRPIAVGARHGGVRTDDAGTENTAFTRIERIGLSIISHVAVRPLDEEADDGRYRDTEPNGPKCRTI